MQRTAWLSALTALFTDGWNWNPFLAKKLSMDFPRCCTHQLCKSFAVPYYWTDHLQLKWPMHVSIISSVSGEQWTTIQNVGHATNLWQGECSKSDNNKYLERIDQLMTEQWTEPILAIKFLIYSILSSPPLVFVFLGTDYHFLVLMDNLCISELKSDILITINIAKELINWWVIEQWTKFILAIIFLIYSILSSPSLFLYFGELTTINLSISEM